MLRLSTGWLLTQIAIAGEAKDLSKPAPPGVAADDGEEAHR
jgi:hypothetical protein